MRTKSRALNGKVLVIAFGGNPIPYYRGQHGKLARYGADIVVSLRTAPAGLFGNFALFHATPNMD